ncbi:hypothetical protein QE152_g4357 [Popillia japonica]|uniref:Uncharacterized protein n=1 Tax=Popillia japonica TaxID=7064 RepID=A0AAW1N144_POPJA
MKNHWFVVYISILTRFLNHWQGRVYLKITRDKEITRELIGTLESQPASRVENICEMPSTSTLETSPKGSKGLADDQA